MGKILIIMMLGFVSAAANAQDKVVTKLNPHSVQQFIKLQQQQIELTKQLLTTQQQQLDTANKLLLDAQYRESKNYSWQDVEIGDKLPAGLINANIHGGEPLYICHAKFKNFGVHPGQYTTKGCRITYAGKSYEEKQFALLTGKGKTSWQSSSAIYRMDQQRQYYQASRPAPIGIFPLNSSLPKSSQPICGGHEKSHSLYICRGVYKNQIHVGKVVTGNCNIGFLGKEIYLRGFEILFS